MTSGPTEYLSGDSFVQRLRSARTCDSDLGQLLQSCRDYLLLVANKELPPDVRQKVAPSDLVQETFVEAQMSFAGFANGSSDEFRAWLRQILVNNVADAIRRYRHAQKRETHRELPLDAAVVVDKILPGIPSREETPSKTAQVNELRKRVAGAMDKLSTDYRSIIELRNFEQRTFVEIGRMMNRSPDAARMLWGRAIRKLAAAMGPDHDFSC